MKYLRYRIIRYVDGNGKEVFRVCRKFFMFWIYFKEYHYAGMEDTFSTVKEYRTIADAKKDIENDVENRRGALRRMVNIQEIIYEFEKGGRNDKEN